jgi:ATP phosphoribosyltransferase
MEWWTSPLLEIIYWLKRKGNSSNPKLGFSKCKVSVAVTFEYNSIKDLDGLRFTSYPNTVNEYFNSFGVTLIFTKFQAL